MKKDELYSELLKRRVLTTRGIVKAAEGIVSNPTTRHVLKKYVSRFIEDGKLVRIRRGLYAALAPLDDPETFIPGKFLVGTKVRSEGFLGYHTALEFHGCANSPVYNTIYVCVNPSKKFDKFSFRGLHFKPILVQDTETGVIEEKYLGQQVRVSNMERTFVDSLDRVNYVGGWEECLKSLETARGLDFNRVIDYTLKRDNEFLTRKIGFTLELLRDTSTFYEHLDDEHLKKLSDQVGKSPRYLEGARSPEETKTLNKKWRLYLPHQFEERFLRGV
ncbi:hypothetical protein AKJ42_02100 [candidate division MSBL1 archaeon SCGC-AAA261C02]|uniref:AbiEi antitoxin C-terminal domain-containing protein n=1 Tax=candidate division MSBL1 archaeon SCGC-AAA261C02 TaxID=1698272 RepID=A0A133V0I7_9EURY|nr:hypothetical protein AKJ42_02100 [candidate division MSBL1 archaeon SCGC-AAA261C02]